MAKSWEQLLGGYATNTLTEEEKRQIFAAALEDQSLFDALADEEALKTLLANPEARQRILESLEASGKFQGAVPHQPKLSWFRRPSSLAWAGSIAAMGLALIFGWQMEKEWGPRFKEEQEAELAQSMKKNDTVLRARPSNSATEKVQVEDNQLTLRDKPKQIFPPPAPTAPKPKSSVTAKASKDARLAEPAPPADVQSQVMRQEVKKERRAQAHKAGPKRSKTPKVQHALRDSRVLTPMVQGAQEQEYDAEPSPQISAFADRIEPKESSSSVNVEELFFGQKREQEDKSPEKIGQRSQQLLGGLSSRMEEALQEEGIRMESRQKEPQEQTKIFARGIRYHFVQESLDGNNEVIDGERISRDRSKLRLIIASNMAGSLYVLHALENGQWQMMTPKTSSLPKSLDGAIEVKPYQPVEFALDQVSKPLGKSQASTITALLSSTPLKDLGNWLGTGSGAEQPEISTGEQGTFVIERTPNPQKPFRVQIPLPQ